MGCAIHYWPKMILLVMYRLNLYIYIYTYMSKSSTFSIANALLCICIHMYPMINGEVLGASPVFGTQIMLGLEERLRVKCLLT